MSGFTATDVGARILLFAIASVILSASAIATSYAFERQAISAERASNRTAYVEPGPSPLELALREQEQNSKTK